MEMDNTMAMDSPPTDPGFIHPDLDLVKVKKKEDTLPITIDFIPSPSSVHAARLAELRLAEPLEETSVPPPAVEDKN